MDFHKQYAKPDFAFYNQGLLWGKLPRDRAKIWWNRCTACFLVEEKQHNRCFYRSSTSCGRMTKKNIRNYEHNTICLIAHTVNCEYLDYNHLTEAFGHFDFAYLEPDRNISYESKSVFWDALHYQPWVYKELNNLLLNNSVQWQWQWHHLRMLPGPCLRLWAKILTSLWKSPGMYSMWSNDSFLPTIHVRKQNPN